MQFTVRPIYLCDHRYGDDCVYRKIQEKSMDFEFIRQSFPVLWRRKSLVQPTLLMEVVPWVSPVR